MKINRIGMGLAVVGLLGLSYLGSQIYIDNRLDLVEVPIALGDLAPRTLITKEDIGLIRMPKAYLPNSIILDTDELIGKYTLITGQIPQGSFIYASMVETLQQAKDYPSLLLNEGQVVYALDVDLKSTSGNTLQPFQKIDLYLSLEHNHLTLVDQLIGNVRILSLKDKNGKDLQKASELPKLMLVALDQKLVPLLTKAIALGELILTPVYDQNDPKESILIENTQLLKVLYAR